MAKNVRRVRVWAYRDGHRRLELSSDDAGARKLGLEEVRRLQTDTAVQVIELREHALIPHEDGADAHRRSLWWRNSPSGWHRVADAARHHR